MDFGLYIRKRIFVPCSLPGINIFSTEISEAFGAGIKAISALTSQIFFLLKLNFGLILAIAC
ncbi:MAG: hypothetical protein MUC85_09855, partial [Anaerolineales bacterium]|nr:hypothetical protein [Anaerolineales bacterium]